MADVNNYPSYSHKSREAAREQATEKKKVEKIIDGTAKRKKKTIVQKFLSEFVPENIDLKSYILFDVIIPAAKKAISDTVDMTLYGSGGSRKKRSDSSKLSYMSYYDRNRDQDYRSSNDRDSRGKSGYDDIVLDSRGEAEAVLSGMDELIETYKMVSIADLYEMVGISGNFTDNKYGWTDIRSASVERIPDGYWLKLPKPHLL